MPKARQLAALGVLFVSGALMAQPAAPPAPPPASSPQAPSPGQPGTPPGSVDLQLQQRPTLTPTEMANQVTQYRTNMEAVAKRIQALVDESRKQKDIIRINCLTDKLVQTKANQNIADRSAASMQEAISRADEGASFHEYTRVTIVHQNIQVLGSEADACVGEDLAYVGATRVEVDSTGVPEGDPTQPQPPTPPDLVRPPSASPFI